jgi:hypothetical protein
MLLDDKALRRFQRKFLVVNECWEWIAGCDSHGYSNFSLNNKNWSGHKVSYLHFIGGIPEGFEIDHTCFNTRCVNPLHLEAVTHAENMRRRRGRPVKKTGPRGKQKNPRTHCKNGHEYKLGVRKCETCHNKRHPPFNADDHWPITW